MLKFSSIAIFTAQLLVTSVHADLYPKSSAVLSLDGKSYDRLIAQSNYTSIVEFYSPHCIHCKNLQPIYEKAAQKLAGLAKVAAVNCEKETNRLFCDRSGVQGFPTINIIKPGKTPGKPIVEEYRGSRTAKAIVEAVVDKIPNLVEKPKEENLEKWIEDAGENPVAILFTNKPRISSLLKALAIEFKGSIKFAHLQIPEPEEGIGGQYEIKSLPTLLLMKGGKDGELFRHDGEMNKKILVEFLSQGAAPNPDPAPTTAKASSTHARSHKDEIKKPVVTPESAPSLVSLVKESELVDQCLGPKTGTCLLALLPESSDKAAPTPLIDTLTQLTHKRKQQKRSIIPAFILPESNPKFAAIKAALSLDEKVGVIAINGRREWWRKLAEIDISSPPVIEGSLDSWITSIQLGEGEKWKLPPGLVTGESEESVNDPITKDQSDNEEKTEKINSEEPRDEL